MLGNEFVFTNVSVVKASQTPLCLTPSFVSAWKQQGLETDYQEKYIDRPGDDVGDVVERELLDEEEVTGALQR